jgi:TRAP-type C4-dicarboxylate transport system permease small subunit
MRKVFARTFAGASMVGGLFLLAATIVTGADVLSRWLLNQPVYFAIEFTALSIGAGVLLAFPARFMQRENVAAQLIASLLPRRIYRLVELGGVVISALLMVYIAYVIILQANDKLGLSERTPDMGLPTGPLWTFAAAITTLTAVGAVIATLRFLKRNERS